jgi:hypothetical protein
MSRAYPPDFQNWSLEARNKLFSEEARNYRAAHNGPAARAPEKPPSRIIGAGTFMRSYAPISYTLGGILPSGYLYGLTAKQGSGKTAWKIAATIAVAMNRPDVIGCAVEPGRVAYVSIENPTDFKMKLAVNCYSHNVSYNEIEPRVAIIDGRDTPEQILEGLKLDAEENGPFQLVCFDTFQAGFAAAGAGAFNDNEAVLNYVIRLRPLTMLPGSPSALVAFHPTKNAGEGELIPYGGRQILLPVMRPSTEADVETREKSNADASRALLAAMIADPTGTQADWGAAINQSKGRVNGHLQRLEKERLVVNRLNKWSITKKGIEAVS